MRMPGVLGRGRPPRAEAALREVHPPPEPLSIERLAPVPDHALARHEALLLAPGLEAPPAHRGYETAKRCFDVVASATLLAFSVPFWLLIAVAITLESPGGIFFTQERVGRGGQTFRLRKFRSMRPGAELERSTVEQLNMMRGGPTFKAPTDPRVTRVGRFLRRSSLDELPQLLHILRGEMSFVGPRPLIVEETYRLPPSARQRLLVKPGLTCIWQVSGRSLVGFEQWMAMDVEYVYSRSLWGDLTLLMKTPRAVITARGAY
jgi:lipopolysaccharide/colanic/teichoic acid biosynthesis glycosyltransferase